MFGCAFKPFIMTTVMTSFEFLAKSGYSYGSSCDLGKIIRFQILKSEIYFFQKILSDCKHDHYSDIENRYRKFWTRVVEEVYKGIENAYDISIALSINETSTTCY